MIIWRLLKVSSLMIPKEVESFYSSGTLPLSRIYMTTNDCTRQTIVSFESLWCPCIFVSLAGKTRCSAWYHLNLPKGENAVHDYLSQTLPHQGSLFTGLFVPIFLQYDHNFCKKGGIVIFVQWMCSLEVKKVTLWCELGIPLLFNIQILCLLQLCIVIFQCRVWCRWIGRMVRWGLWWILSMECHVASWSPTREPYHDYTSLLRLRRLPMGCCLRPPFQSIKFLE